MMYNINSQHISVYIYPIGEISALFIKEKKKEKTFPSLQSDFCQLDKRFAGA